MPSAEDLNFTWLIDGRLAGCRGPESDEDLIFIREQGVKALVRLTDIDEAKVSTEQVSRAGLKDLHEPVSDYCPPSQAQIDRIIRFIDEHLSIGEPVAVSCRAGLGRTGTVLACYLIHLGRSVDEALRMVRKNRPGSVATWTQVDAVKKYGQRIKS